jgi:hypothetical protein
MNLTPQHLDIDFHSADLISELSGKPVHIQDDLFAWNGMLIDRATAIVALLKVYNQIPISDSIKLNSARKYLERFKHLEHLPMYVNVYDTVEVTIVGAETMARIWFNKVCKIAKGSVDELPKDVVKQILVTLHS